MTMRNGTWFSAHLVVSDSGIAVPGESGTAALLTETVDPDPRTHELNVALPEAVEPGTLEIRFLVSSPNRLVFVDFCSRDADRGARCVFDPMAGAFLGEGLVYGAFPGRVPACGAEPVGNGWHRAWMRVDLDEPAEEMRLRVGPHGVRNMAPHYAGTGGCVALAWIGLAPGPEGGEEIRFRPDPAALAGPDGPPAPPEGAVAVAPVIEVAPAATAEPEAGPPPKAVAAPAHRTASSLPRRHAPSAPSRLGERPPDLSFICSHGRTSTRWLAQVLNLHPDTLCAHGAILPPFVEKPGFKGRYGKIPEAERRARFATLSVTDMIETMWRQSRAPYNAWIHAISVRTLMERMEAERYVRNVTICSIVRHPVSRANSYWKHFCRLLDTPAGIARAEQFRAEWDADDGPQRYVDAVNAAFPDVDFSKYENMFFVMAVRSLGLDYQELKYCHPIFRMEDLVADDDYFTQFLKTAFRSGFPVGPDYMAAVRAHPVANFTTKPTPPKATFQTWLPWQKHCFRLFMEFQGLVVSHCVV